MPNGKSPGNDGLPKEFYLAFFEVLANDMKNCFNECFNKGQLSTSQKQAVITLINKPGKDVRHLKSWRPISLLNVDAKIISKILAARLTDLLPKLISEDQTAYVKDRYIGEPIRLVQDIMHYTDQNQIPGILFAADFSAAFDSLDYSFMFAALKHYNFHENFVRWVKTMHNNVESCVLNAGYSTGYFKLERGTRQGDPLAPYLFILILGILCEKVRQNKSIRGILVGNREVKQCLYADDTTYFFKDTASLLHLKQELDTFKDVTSLSVNYEKSEAAWLGLLKTCSDTPGDYKWKNLTKETIRVLGIYISYNEKLIHQENFDRVQQELDTVLKLWKSRCLTIYGKGEIIKSLALSKVMYGCNMLVPPSNFLQNIKSSVTKFGILESQRLNMQFC